MNTETEWFTAKQLPTKTTWYLVLTTAGYYVCVYDAEKDWGWLIDQNVLYWTLLPPPPDGAEELIRQLLQYVDTTDWIPRTRPQTTQQLAFEYETDD